MKFWQAITWSETGQLIKIAKFAEELGFHGVMSGDHAVYPESIAPDYPYAANTNESTCPFKRCLASRRSPHWHCSSDCRTMACKAQWRHPSSTHSAAGTPALTRRSALWRPSQTISSDTFSVGRHPPVHRARHRPRPGLQAGL